MGFATIKARAKATAWLFTKSVLLPGSVLVLVACTLSPKQAAPENKTFDAKSIEANTIEYRNTQWAVEALALRLLGLPEVRQAREEVRERYFLAHPSANSKDAIKTLENALDETVWGAMLSVAADDRANPALIWWNNPPRNSHGLNLPGGRYAFDSTDRVYRYFAVDPQYRYEIRGYRETGTDTPSLLLESCLDAPPGWGFPQVFIMPEEIEYNADGSFVITVDNTPANGRKNHLYMTPETRHIMLRNTIQDWTNHMPSQISVRRVDGAEVAPLRFEDYASRAAEKVHALAKVNFWWFDEKNERFAGPGLLEANTEIVARVRPSSAARIGWGMTGSGRFSIADDEALVFTVDLQSAEYLHVMLADPWMLSIDFMNRPSTLNQFQSHINADGSSITYVISKSDPGTHNWLDTGGLNDGVFLIRWERMTKTPSPETEQQAIGDIQRVKLADLASVLPKDMPRVSYQQRLRQNAARSLGYQNRRDLLLRKVNLSGMAFK